MTPEQITTIATGILQGGGIVAFVALYLRGVNRQIGALKGAMEIQEKALLTMEKRILETEKIGDLYKNFVSDVPKMMADYKAIVTTTHADISVKLEQTTREKLDAVAKLAEAERTLRELKDSDTDKRKTVLATIFLYQKQNEDFSKFLEQVETDRAALADILVRSATLDDLLQECGYQLKIDNNQEIISKTIFRETPISNPDEIAKYASWGVGGFYIIFTNRRIVMDDRKRSQFQAGIDNLKISVSG
jgi:hypothetical protein